MRKESGRDVIRVRGARQNNLKGFDLELPTRALVVITGLSGSGKSSLAFDTLYAEGQRRYIETFSPYARQFFDRMDKPRVDAIEGIPPAIALEQRNTVRTTRSTVGTMTEICDHMKVLWPHLARLHCRQCGRPVRKDAPGDVWRQVGAGDGESAPRLAADDSEVLVTFPVPLSPKLGIDEQLALVARQGFRRLLIGGDVVRVEDAQGLLPEAVSELVVIQDRVRPGETSRTRFVEACEQAYHFGHGRLAVVEAEDSRRRAMEARETGRPPPHWTIVRPFSRKLHCAHCDLEYQEPTPALFSFNHPIGACPTCKGFGRIIAIDDDLAVPDRSKSLGAGAVKPWQTGMSAECQSDLVRFARKVGIPLDVPFEDLEPGHQRWVIEGDPDYGEGNEWPKAWYGVRGYFRWLESKAYKMHVRVLLSRYRVYRRCPACQGQRFQPDALLWRLPVEIPQAVGIPSGRGMDPIPGGEGLTLAAFYALPIHRALALIEGLAGQQANRPSPRDAFSLALAEVRARLAFLEEVGVGYLSLDRPTRTLSGGETQRVSLTTCLGSRLVNTLFVLDEPSVGLHPRDTGRLVRILERLRDLGNTVVVVEHEPAVMRAADQIVDLGPGHGEAGGEVVIQGDCERVLRHPGSLTGAYLSGRRRIELPARRPVNLPDNPLRARDRTMGGGAGAGVNLREQRVPYVSFGAAAEERATPALVLRGITQHNLRNVDVAIPLGRLVCFSGVSGSGKTTLAGELLRLLRERMGDSVSKGGFGVREAEQESEKENEKENEKEEDDPADAADEVGERGARLDGSEALGAVMLVDQAPAGRTPRSNPGLYTGAFDHIRELFAQTDAARQSGLSASSFSFNSPQGQCEQCRGAGFEKIEMQFLSDVYIRCPACNGHRYRPHILAVRLAPPAATGTDGSESLSVADLLDQTVDQALRFLDAFQAPSAVRAAARLRVLQEVGLGYLKVGQPMNTLSGGESQRLKLAGHLAEAVTANAPQGEEGTGAVGRRPTLFVFDEPTTGLHVEDVRVLLGVFQRLVDRGESVLIIEHNLEVLKCADWVIDLGPEGGEQGGRVVVAGPPEAVAACDAGHTGRALREVLGAGSGR